MNPAQAIQLAKDVGFKRFDTVKVNTRLSEEQQAAIAPVVYQALPEQIVAFATYIEHHVLTKERARQRKEQDNAEYWI